MTLTLPRPPDARTLRVNPQAWAERLDRFHAGLIAELERQDRAQQAATAAVPVIGYGRMSSMTITPGPGLSVVVSGSYWAGKEIAVAKTVAISDLSHVWYIIGDAKGRVSVTSTAPPPVYPVPSNTAPVLLAVICKPDLGNNILGPVGATAHYQDQLGEADGIITVFAGSLAYTPIVPGSVKIYGALGAVVGTDDGAGHITGAPLSAGTVNYATGAISVTFIVAPAYGVAVTPVYDYTRTLVHKTHILRFPPADNPAAWARKLRFDAGGYNIPGKDFQVGVSDKQGANLADLTATPFGLDSAIPSVSGDSSVYVSQASHRTYGNFKLTGTLEFPAAGGGAVLSAANDGGGHVAVSVDSSPQGYIDATTVSASLSDGTALGPFFADRFQRLSAVELPLTGWTGQTVGTVTGGGARGNTIKDAWINLFEENVGIKIEDVGAPDPAALYDELTIENVTITWVDKTTLLPGPSTGNDLGGQSAIRGMASIRGRNIKTRYLAVGVYYLHNSTYENLDMADHGITFQPHGSCINIFGANASGVAAFRAVDGCIGYSRISGFRMSCPPVSSPRYGNTNTSPLNFETGPGDAVGIGVSDNVFENGLFDGGGWWAAFLGTSHTNNAPIRRQTIRNIWVTPTEFDYSRDGIVTGGFQFHGGPNQVDDIYIYNLFEFDTGEALTDLNGVWSISSNGDGVLTKAALPELDLYGEPIVVEL